MSSAQSIALGAFSGDVLDSEALGALYDQVEHQQDRKSSENTTNKFYSKANRPENVEFGYSGYLNSEGGCRDGMCRAVQGGIRWVFGAVEFYLQLPARRESTGSWAFLVDLSACPDPAFGKAVARGSPLFWAALCSPFSHGKPWGGRGGCPVLPEEEKDGIPPAVCAVLLLLCWGREGCTAF